MILNARSRPEFLQPLGAPGALRWSWRHLAGRVVELSGADDTAVLTLACGLIKEAQRLSEPAAWIGRADSMFFPPDAAESGVDLDSLIVVRAPQPPAALRAADRLVRSSAFGIVVLDLGKEREVPLPLLARLAGIARRHHTVVLFLTEKPVGSASLSPLISVGAESRRQRVSGERFRCALLVTKDKHGAPASEYSVDCRGPVGLR